MSQRAKFHHRHHGRPLKERCRQIGCGGELREMRPGFGYPEHVEGTRAARRAGLHGTPIKLGYPGRCNRCGTHVNIRTILGVEIDGQAPASEPESAHETVKTADVDELNAALEERGFAPIEAAA